MINKGASPHNTQQVAGITMTDSKISVSPPLQTAAAFEFLGPQSRQLGPFRCRGGWTLDGDEQVSTSPLPVPSMGSKDTTFVPQKFVCGICGSLVCGCRAVQSSTTQQH